MTNTRKTCAGCKHLKRHITPALSGLFMGCNITESVIPHSSRPVDGERGEWEVIFWRVPLECPLSDGVVFKNEERAPRREWVTQIIKAKQ